MLDRVEASGSKVEGWKQSGRMADGPRSSETQTVLQVWKRLVIRVIRGCEAREPVLYADTFAGAPPAERTLS